MSYISNDESLAQLYGFFESVEVTTESLPDLLMSAIGIDDIKREKEAVKRYLDDKKQSDQLA